MHKKDKEKIINKVRNNDIENNIEKEIYLEYLNDELKNLKLKNRFDNLVLIKDIFVYFKVEYDYIHAEKHDFFIFFYLFCITIGLGGILAEMAVYETVKNLYFLKSSLGFASIPVIFSLIISMVKFSIPNKIKLNLSFKEHKEKLKEEIKAVQELKFENDKSKEQDNNNIFANNERYILNSKEKTKIYETINNLLIKIKNLPESKEKTYYAIELNSIVMDFDNKRINLENLNPNNQNLIINNKVNIELSILQRLNNLDNQINSFLNKENRMEEDKVKVKNILDELKPLTRK